MANTWFRINTILKWMCLVFYIQVSVYGIAQTNTQKLDSSKCDFYLQGESVNDIFIDKNGKKWISASKVIKTFDNISWENIGFEDENKQNWDSIPYWAAKISTDAYGSMLFVNYNGAYMYNGSKWEFTPGGINSITMASDSTFFFHFREGKYQHSGFSGKDTIYLFDQSKYKVNYVASFPHHFISDLKGNTWALDNKNLLLYSKGKWKKYKIPFPTGDELDNFENVDIGINSLGVIWITSDYTSTWLIKFDKGKFTIVKKIDSFPSIVEHIAVDNDGNLWIPFVHDGFGMFDGNTLKIIQIGYSLETINGVESIAVLKNIGAECMAVDNDNSIWIGTNKGLIHYKR